MSLVFTMPGKIGDALHQWPIAYHYCRVNGVKCEVWLDQTMLKPLVPLFEAQSCVESVKLIAGVVNWNCGGQPWHFDLITADVAGHQVFHLGLRGFPNRPITLETLACSKVPLDIDQWLLAETPSLEISEGPIRRRVVLHGQPVCPHNRQTPRFWKFIAAIMPELQERFEVAFVGSVRDREIAKRTYPWATDFDDGGDFRLLAEYIGHSELMIGCGSAPVALAGALKIPAIRVHDEIGEAPKAVFSNLGENQLNETEVALRRLWPEFRDRWVLSQALDSETSQT